MTELDLAEIKARREAVGKEWRLYSVDDEDGGYVLLVVDGNGYARITTHAPKSFLAFIGHVHTDVPMLVQALEEAQKAIESAIDDEWGLASLTELRRLVGRELGESE